MTVELIFHNFFPNKNSVGGVMVECHHVTWFNTEKLHCNTLQHTATHCNTLQHTASQKNQWAHTATHCNTLQHTATHYNTEELVGGVKVEPTTHCNTGKLTLQHTFFPCLWKETHCNTEKLLAGVKVEQDHKECVTIFFRYTHIYFIEIR